MIEPYYGEFLISPVPLELTLYRCSHACAFCFANHGARFRPGSVRSVVSFLKRYRSANVLAARLLARGYPVCLSNRADPFAESNARATLALLQLFVRLDVRVQIQTRCGPGMDEAMEMLPPSVWYISVGTVDEELRRRIEPNAPPVEERLQQIRRLRRLNHRVVVGFNPCVPEWSTPVQSVLDAVRDAGAEGVWIEPLHLNSDQEAALTQREREALTEPIIRRARKRVRAQEEIEHILAARAYAREIGLEVYTGNQGCPSQFWGPWRDLYRSTFPTVQDWINSLGDEPREVAFDEFAAFFIERLPDISLVNGSRYVMSSANHRVWTSNRWSVDLFRDWEGVLEAIWQEPRCAASPTQTPAFTELPGEHDRARRRRLLYSPVWM